MLGLNTASLADAIAMKDFRMLRRGMNEADILYRVGAYDHETGATDYYQNIINKTWYYIPAPHQFSSQKWITEISFDRHGLVKNIDRYRP